MAQGNLLQGQGTGKVGDLVFMVRQGVQVARVYTKAGARSGDAASEASRIQRVRFGSASNQWDLYKYVCTRMYRKGKSGNQSDYNYFVKRNNALLPYLTKTENADGIHCLMPGLLSEGKLGRVELTQSYVSAAGGETQRLILADSQVATINAVKWTDTMALLKSRLRSAYAAASKVTFLFSFAPTTLVEEGEITMQSQMVVHTPVHISLYEEAQSGENNMTCAQYFAARFTGALSDLLAGQGEEFFCYTNILCRVTATTADAIDLIKTLAVSFFATDDNASDCYSTMLPLDAVPSNQGPYVLYFQHRTQDALRLACESYGYQSGVMRDDIAKFGNDLQQQQQAYTARLRSLGLDVESAEE